MFLPGIGRITLSSLEALGLRLLAVVFVTVLLSILAVPSKQASAATAIKNGNFETGDLSGWDTSPAGGGYASAVTGYGSYGPKEGSYFALLTPGQADVDTMISQPFSAASGDEISGWAFFKSEEGSSAYTTIRARC